MEEQQVPLLSSDNYGHSLSLNAEEHLQTQNWTTRLKELLNTGALDPDSKYRRVWYGIIFAIVLWNAFIIPLRISFQLLWATLDSAWIYTLDYIGDLFFLVDIWLNFRTTYMHQGLVISNPKLMAQNYIRNWFFLDLIASLPIDLFCWIVWEHAVLRIPKLIRLSKSWLYFGYWQRHSKDSRLFLFAELTGGIFLLSHWLCCLYFMLGYIQDFQTAWTPPKALAHSSLSDQYLYSIYWALNVVTGVGSKSQPAETATEMVFMMIVAVVVLVIVAALIGSLVELVATMNASCEEFKQKITRINLFMKNKNLPEELRRRVRMYYKHLWSRHSGLNDEKILEELPMRLKTEISLEMNGDIISKVPFFQDCNPSFVNSLVVFLKPEIYVPGDWIVREGDVGHEMYFISEGQVDVLVKDEVVTSMGEGGFFGEIGLLLETKRTASIRATTYCDLSVLRKKDLEKVLKIFPEQRSKILQTAELRMTNDSLRHLGRQDPLFNGASQKFQNELFKCFQSQIVLPSQYLYHVGEEAGSLFFLGSGTIQILSAAEEVIQTLVSGPALQEGCFLGIEAVLGLNMKESAKAVDRCNVCVLQKQDLDNLLQKYPSEKQRLEAVAKKMNENGSHISLHTPPFVMQKTLSMANLKAPLRRNKFNSTRWMQKLQNLGSDDSISLLSKDDMAMTSNAIHQLQFKLIQALAKY